MAWTNNEQFCIRNDWAPGRENRIRTHSTPLRGPERMYRDGRPLASTHPNARSDFGDTALHLRIRRRLLGRRNDDEWEVGRYAVEPLTDFIDFAEPMSLYIPASWPEASLDYCVLQRFGCMLAFPPSGVTSKYSPSCEQAVQGASLVHKIGRSLESIQYVLFALPYQAQLRLYL